MERVPILKIGDILLVSIQVDMSDQTAVALQEPRQLVESRPLVVDDEDGQ